jgi:hypothetical protein
MYGCVSGASPAALRTRIGPMAARKRTPEGSRVATEEAKPIDVGTVRLQGSGSVPGYSDVVTWAERQAALLRRIGAGEKINDEVDWENVAEEIESVGQSERRSLAGQVRNILEHLAKLEVSPATEPRAGWKDTVLRARSEIEDLLEASPSLRPKLEEVIARQLPKALKLAASSLALRNETPQVPVDQIRYTTEQVVGDWFPS